MAARLKEFAQVLQEKKPQSNLVWGMLILGALLAFEVFNYSTTDFAMTDLLGDLRFAGIRWATILAIAFCGIDFAGIVKLFTPGAKGTAKFEVWYLFAAWLLAATMNAILTWWGVSIAVASHVTLGNEIIARETLLTVVPVFVALTVWLLRVLIIGTFSVAGGRIFSNGTQTEAHKPARPATKPIFTKPMSPTPNFTRTPVARNASAAGKSSYTQYNNKNQRQAELNYEPVQMKSNNSNFNNTRS